MALTQAQDVIQGMDVTVSAAGASGPVSAPAQNVEFTVTARDIPYYELGDTMPLHLDGAREITGTLRATWRDPALAMRLFGAASIQRGDPRVYRQPFTISLTVKTPGHPAYGRRAQLTGCKVTTFGIATRDAENPIDAPIAFVADGFSVA
jgi:hypothetical protein